MKTTPLSAPFTRADLKVQSIMRAVLVALMPGTAVGLFIFGWPAVFLFLVTVLAALGFEWLCLLLAGKPVRSTLADGSALLTGWLLALSLPPWAPWWIGVVGALLAIVVGKQVFGGLGQNLFNPAMLARVALLIAFPLEMTTWIDPAPVTGNSSPGFGTALAITFQGLAPPDGMTGATALGWIKTEYSQGRGLSESLSLDDFRLLPSFLGWTRGSLGETSTLLFALGGLWMLHKRIITWHIPLSMLSMVVVLSSLFSLADAARYPGPLFHLTTGALMLGAFFIATDYVTSPNSRAGQILFGAGCGLIVFVIRSWGGYPEGMGFAVLLMNSLTPVIDHYVRPRIYGRDRRGRPLELPEAGK